VSRLEGIFEALRGKRAALITYLVTGDPDAAATVPAMHALVEGGADIIELAMPFSDPEADGPDIQLGHERALAHGTRMADVFDAVRSFREQDSRTGVVLMGYLNPIERIGHEHFAQQASAAGVDGLILVNLPPEEATELRATLQAHGLDLILLVAPTTTDARAKAILAAASGFAYYVSLKGTTGAGNLDVAGVEERLRALRAFTTLPLAVGFGIRGFDAARSVGQFADAVVVGSAVVRAMGEHAERTEAIPGALRELVGELRTALDARA